MVETNDIVYTKSPLKANPYGIIKHNSGTPGIVSTLYAVYHPKKNANAQFIDYFFQNNLRLNKYLKPLVNIGAKHDMKVNNEVAISGRVIFPAKNEQDKISEFLTVLDGRINTQRKLIDALKLYRRGVLSAILPSTGETTPAHRLSGFSGTWKLYKVGEIAERTYGGGTPKTGIAMYWHGDIPWIQSSNVTEHELFCADVQKYVTKAGVQESATQLIPKDSIAIVSHVGVGKLVLMPFEYTTSQDFISLSGLKTDPVFTCYALYKRLQEDVHIVQGSAIKGITKETLLKKEIAIPEENEQKSIGATLQRMDTMITLHQHKCDLLLSVKQSLLQQMFI